MSFSQCNKITRQVALSAVFLLTPFHKVNYSLEILQYKVSIVLYVWTVMDGLLFAVPFTIKEVKKNLETKDSIMLLHYYMIHFELFEYNCNKTSNKTFVNI